MSHRDIADQITIEEVKTPLFSRVSVDMNNMAEVLLENSLRVSEERFSLQEIIRNHKDNIADANKEINPDAVAVNSNNVYKFTTISPGVGVAENNPSTHQDEYTLIRTKSILSSSGHPAVGIYFQNMTYRLKQLRLKS